MSEKKVTKISLSTFLLLLAIMIIIVLSIFIYNLYTEKTIEAKKSSELQEQIDNLNLTLNYLQVKLNSISKDTTNTDKTQVIENSNSTNNLSIITTLDGKYEYNGELESLTFVFSKNNVKFASLSTSYGTYQIVNNKVKITYTKAEDPEGNDVKEFPDGQTDELTILDENTLVNSNGIKFLKK